MIGSIPDKAPASSSNTSGPRLCPADSDFEPHVLVARPHLGLAVLHLPSELDRGRAVVSREPFGNEQGNVTHRLTALDLTPD